MNLANWQKTTTVTMFVSDGESEQEYRLTFATCNNLDVALFNRRRGHIFVHLRKEYGDVYGQNDEAMALGAIMISHAVILAALKRVEIRDGDNWTETKLPETWYDWQRFPTEAPAGMIDTLVEAAYDAGNSPRLFSFVPASDEEKKVLRLTVTQ
jgi:hypothetical protein